MPAKNLRRVAEGGSYIHVYNRGIENKIIFADDDDYNTFLNYLEEYLSAPKNPQQHKTDFTIKGRHYKGVPHLPKNYHNKVELLAFSLNPDHFHILLHQKEGKSLQAFIRSLCTRYSMYFNKKYKRAGTLFNGPYKSAHLKDINEVRPLINYLHKESVFSSTSYYSQENTKPWVKTNVILLDGTDTEKDKQNNTDYEFGQTQHETPAQTIKQVPLERRDLQVVYIKPWARIPEIMISCLLLLVLLAFGLKGIADANSSATISTKVLGIKIVHPFQPAESSANNQQAP